MDNDSGRILEHIDGGSLRFEETAGGSSSQFELEAADTLGVLLRRITVVSGKAARPELLKGQAVSVIERLNWLEPLKLIEVDGIGHAVQIRSKSPSEVGFNEVILRQGNSVSFERRGASALHLSRKQFVRLADELAKTL